MPPQDRKVTLDLVRRAEKAGYKALAVTVDTPVLGRREADIRNKFTLPTHLTMGMFIYIHICIYRTVYSEYKL